MLSTIFFFLIAFSAHHYISNGVNPLLSQNMSCWMCDSPHCTQCVASQWTPWGSCSSPCGRNGYQKRTRLVYRPQSCVAHTTCRDLKDAEWQPCNRFCHNGGTPARWFCACPPNYTGHCCESDALGWSRWGAWSECSKSCATGVQSRSRTCHSPFSSNSSNCVCGCTGPSIDTRTCKTFGCEVELQALGCFKAGSPTSLPALLKNLRSQIDWNNMTNTVDACAKVARASGHSLFGIQFYGECWSGKDAGKTYDRHGPSQDCWCGVGKDRSFFVYNQTS